jgi:CheY-like chemotaxis protein
VSAGRTNSPTSNPAKKILVVDDEKAICEVMSLVLERAGYCVVAANSPEEAIAAMRVDEFPVMFIDFNLPGMSGADLCKTIKSAYPGCIAFLVTGYAPESVLSECRSAGFKDFLIKPVDLKILCAVAGEAFGEERQQGQNRGLVRVP